MEIGEYANPRNKYKEHIHSVNIGPTQTIGWGWDPLFLFLHAIVPVMCLRKVLIKFCIGCILWEAKTIQRQFTLFNRANKRPPQ
jgi:hypothetical protein